MGMRGAAVTDHTECITIGSVLGMNLHDVNVYGPGQSGSSQDPLGGEAVVMQNGVNWMERWRIANVNFGGFAVNLHFKAPVLQGGVFAAVLDGGSGYTTTPVVTFGVPNAKGGVRAEGVALVAAGAVQEIVMTKQGTGYGAAPAVTLSYGNARVQAYGGTGTDSFGYGKLSGVWTNQGQGAVAWWWTRVQMFTTCWGGNMR